tara:strand:- start:702 stop:869 length:168 start_codon:yes stop_codon:yes gene_type:complete
MEGDKEEKSTSRKLQDEREELHPDMFERDESVGNETDWMGVMMSAIINYNIIFSK